MQPGAMPEPELGRQGRWASAALALGLAIAPQAPAQPLPDSAAKSPPSLQAVLAACTAPDARYDTTVKAVAAMGWQPVTPPAKPPSQDGRFMALAKSVGLYIAQTKTAAEIGALSTPQGVALALGLQALQSMAFPGTKAAPAAARSVSFSGPGVSISVARPSERTANLIRRYFEPQHYLPASAGVACTLALAPADEALLTGLPGLVRDPGAASGAVLGAGRFEAAAGRSSLQGSYYLYDLPGLWKVAGADPQSPPPPTLLILKTSSIRANR
ncbi:hypothetical protein [Solirhodobacter olei]|uniref:hypothetical protein n=1 Tax=Solirhodobacter olei TaxID=2493082 RepID=UPI000FDA46A4|nr:hypothetical protein [Solirhodobacter olei]